MLYFKGTIPLYYNGAIAQLGERLPCTQEVCSSILHSSTIFFVIKKDQI